MVFSSDRTVNLLNLHYAFLNTALQMLILFSMVFLYKSGVPLHFVFLAYGFLYFSRLFFRPFALMVINKFGLKKALIFGTMFLFVPALLIIPVQGMNKWLYMFIIVSAITDCFYWLPYHTFFASAGSTEKRGSSLGAREGLTKLGSIVGPFLSGFLLAKYGPLIAFGMASFLYFLSAIPVFFVENLPTQKINKKQKKDVSKFGMKIFIVWGFMQLVTAWPIIMFKLFNENFGTFGWLLSLLGFFMAIGSFVLGKLIDGGKGKSIYRLAILLLILTNLGRALFAYDLTTVIIFDVLYSIAMCLFMPVSMAAIYNLSKESKNPLYFQYYAEAGWDIGAVLAMICCSSMAFFGFDLRYSLVLSAIGAVMTGIGLYFYYEKKPKVKIDIAENSVEAGLIQP